MTAIHRLMERLAYLATAWAGSSWAFILALTMVVFWLVSGPYFGYGDTWQLVMNTISSIVTFLMVFLLQRSENKESQAMQIKLNEIVAAMPRASNRLINIEDLPEEEVRELHEYYQKLAQRARAKGKKVAPGAIEQGLKQPEAKGGVSVT